MVVAVCTGEGDGSIISRSFWQLEKKTSMVTNAIVPDNNLLVFMASVYLLLDITDANIYHTITYHKLK